MPIPITALRRCAVSALALLIAALALPAGAEAPAVPDVSQQQARDWIASGEAPLFLDVRTPAEFAGGHVPGAINIPHDALPARTAELAKHEGEPVVVYCESGRRAAIAAAALQQAGFAEVRHLAGDMSGWRAAGLPVEK